MTNIILPTVRALYLCERYSVGTRRTIDLIGVMHGLRVPTIPVVLPNLVVFAQLTGGLGKVPFFVEVVEASEGKAVYRTPTHHLDFASRLAVVHLALTIRDCRIPRSGEYLVELYRNQQFLTDARLSVTRK